MDHIRIAIRDSTDSMNICFLDNKAGIKFHETNLQRFLKGTCNFLTLKFYGKDIDTIYPGCRLAFKYGDNDYWLTINSFKKNGYECSLTAYSLSLETNKEKRKAFKAPKWTFKQYLDYVDPEHSLTLGLNEVASQSMKLEWSGTDTILARLFSIANSFGAELEFVTELNDDYSLKRHVLNVYKVGNIGKDKTGMPIRVDKSLKVINYTANIDELYTAIRVHGKDGLTIAGLDKKVYDSDKKLLYYIQGDTLYAPQARDRFPAIAHKASDSFICLEGEDTEHSSKESLYAYMLGELKKHSEPKIDYETEGYVDGEIGDRMLLIDGVHYDPPLYVQARISEQTISLLDKSKNKTVFTNYERKKSEIANELLAKMNALIEENKVYDVQILTSNGYSFKNGFGETKLTARVMDGAKDVTSEFSLTWFKNSTEYAHTASINVQAGSIDDLATYLIIAEKDGRERGRNELTVFNVKDGSPGKTPVVHLAWADSADGTVKFTTELPTDWIPKYRGYYVDYSSVASTNPKVYKWERNPDDAGSVADEAKDKADAADSKADSAIDTANSAKDTADEASKQTALVNGLANAAKELADKANADAAEANRLVGLANTEIGKLNTNVDNVKNDLAAAEQEFANSLETTTRELTAKISGIDVGGRNLLKDTANFGNSGRPSDSKDGWLNSYHDSTVESEKYNGLTVRSLKNVSSTKSMCDYYFTGFNLGDTYTLSFWAKGTINTFRCYFYGDSGFVGAKVVNASIPYSSTSGFADGRCTFTKPQITNWTRISITWQLADTGDINIAKRVLIRTDEATGGDLYVCGMKFEKGNKATDWSPAPEDFESDLSNTSIELSTKITESAAKLRTEMSEKYSTKNDLTALQGEYNSFKEQTAKKFSQQVSSIQTIQTDTINAKQLANDAYSKANSAVTSATNASSTVNSALTKASDASSVANSANQNATSAVASANSAVSTASQAKSNADKAIADVASLTKTVSSQSTRIDQTSSRIEQVASGVVEVGNKLDNLQVGSRNLALNSGREVKNRDYRLSYYYISPSEGELLSNGYGHLVDGKKYTIVICLTTDSTINEIYAFLSSGFQGLGSISLEKNKKQVVSLDFTARYYSGRYPSNHPEYAKLELYRYPNPYDISGAGYVTVHWVKIVDASGVVVKDWSPAPEDQQSQIDSINTNLANNYYAKTAVDSKLSTAVSGITAQYTKDISTQLNNYYDKATMDRRLTIGDVGIETYVKNTQSKLNNLSIGSDNLIINGGFPTDTSGWDKRGNGRFEVRKHPFYFNDKKKMFCIITNVKTQGYEGQEETIVYSEYFSVKPNTDYTLSFVGFSSSNVASTEVHYMGKINKDDNSYSNITTLFNKANMPYSYCQYYQYTFNSRNSNVGMIRFDNNGSTNGENADMYFGEVMLVEGNVAKKYQPSSAEFPTLTQYTQVKQLSDQLSAAVYDSSTGLMTKTNQLAGKYAIQNLNSYGDVLSSLNLNGGNVRIKGGLIDLDGNVRIQDAFINNLVANSIVTNKIKATEISGDIIKGGTIQGVKITSNNGPGNVTLNYGRIEMDLIEPIESNVNRNSIGTFTPSYVTMASYIDRGATPQLDGLVMLDYTGFTSRIKDDDGTIQDRRLEFNSEGFNIYPINASSYALNSGIRLFGRHAYLDLNGNKTTKTKGTVSRIISGPDGSMQIINNYGNIYLNTKNGVQPMSNGYKLPYTWANDKEGIRYFRIVRPDGSDAYIEIANNARVWGVNMWLSDQRLKSNITTPTQDALATINQLQVRQFDWKSDNVHEDFGLVAQEVEQILPNAVFKVGDYYQIKDSGLIPVLIGAVQKLSNKVNLLENIIYNTKGSNLL